MPDADFTGQAKLIVTLVRAHTTSEAEAVELVAQALITAHSGGQAEAVSEVGANMLRTLDRAAAAKQ